MNNLPANQTQPSMKPHEPSPVSTWNRTTTNAVSRSPIALLAALVLTLTPPSSAARAAQFERIVSDPLGADSTFAAAWADFNRDGLLDVCTIDGQITLYENQGNGTFKRITSGNAMVEAPYSLGSGLIWGDYNNDGLPDLFFIESQGDDSVNYLFRNDGEGAFTRVGEGHIVNTVASGYSSVWGDFDNDGWIDLFVGNWVGDGQGRNFLYRNDAGQGFTLMDQGVMATPFANAAASAGSAAGDFDGDGRLDVINLTVQPENARLYRNLGNFEFEIVDPFPNFARPDAAHAVAVADYDNDGDLDVLTAAADLGGWNGLAQLWQNDGRGNFTRIPGDLLFGADVVGVRGIAWGDYDNDGWLDVVMVRSQLFNRQPGETTNFLFRNNGDGTFSRVAEDEIVTNTGDSASVTWADIDNDGFLDLLICNYDEPNLLMRNLGNDNHWLKLELRGTTSNAGAIGAKVRVKATIQGEEMWQLREIGTSQGWLTYQSDMRPHFGLGDAPVAEVVRIEWPSGIVQELANVSADQILKVTEPPRLSIGSNGTTAILSWPARAQGYGLFSAEQPDGPWEPVERRVVISGHQATVEVSIGGSVQFYRLQLP
jgi:enediyne biosynthesis protein E4